MIFFVMVSDASSACCKSSPSASAIVLVILYFIMKPSTSSIRFLEINKSIGFETYQTLVVYSLILVFKLLLSSFNEYR